MIKVVNKYKHTPVDNDFYIGRGSGLGNPYSHLDSDYKTIKVDTREEAVENFRDLFYTSLVNDKFIKSKLERIKQLEEKYGDVNLVCFCKPKACHGDVIAEYLNSTGKSKEDYLQSKFRNPLDLIEGI